VLALQHRFGNDYLTGADSLPSWGTGTDTSDGSALGIAMRNPLERRVKTLGEWIALPYPPNWGANCGRKKRQLVASLAPPTGVCVDRRAAGQIGL
jgi:hypothetical protein